MTVRSLLSASVLTLILGVPAVALADAAPPECLDAESGDPCTTPDDRQGTCVDVDGSGLECVENTVASASSGGTGTTSSTTAATSGGTGGSDGGTGGGSGTGGSTPGGETDEGCAVRAPSGKSTTRLGAGLVFVAAAAVAARRWQRRSSST